MMALVITWLFLKMLFVNSANQRAANPAMQIILSGGQRQQVAFSCLCLVYCSVLVPAQCLIWLFSNDSHPPGLGPTLREVKQPPSSSTPCGMRRVCRLR